ncbi:unnamed protein product, partial [Didymodactylos carnosus]
MSFSTEQAGKGQNSMPKTIKFCQIDSCKREAETHCYHCSQDVCAHHFFDHKQSIKNEMNPLTDQINTLTVKINELKPSSINIEQPFYYLEQWRNEVQALVNDVYTLKRQEIETIVQNHEQEFNGYKMEQMRTLDTIRNAVEEFVNNGDV